MMLGVLVVAAVGVEASTETSPAKLKATYNANVRREITDADFFGSFMNGSWAKKPMLNYAYSPKLKSVETAAKAGDYKQAGVELLAYFRNKYSNPKTKPRGNKSLRVAMWQDHIFGFDQPPNHSNHLFHFRVCYIKATYYQFLVFFFLSRRIRINEQCIAI